MAIQNGIGIVSYPRRMSRGLEGQPAESELPLADTYRVPLIGQVNTVTVGGFGADADSVTISITVPDGTVYSVTTTRAAGVPADDAAAAAALAAAINALAGLNTHADATSNSAVVTITFKHPNVVYTVATSVTAATAAVAQTQAPGGTAITPGRFVTSGTELGGIPIASELGNSAVEADVRGVVLREQLQPNAGSTLSTAVDQVQPGSLIAVAYRNKVLMRNNGSVAAARGGLVYVVVNTAGGQERGMARADDDAANAIVLSVSRARWAEAVAVGAIGAIHLNI